MGLPPEGKIEETEDSAETVSQSELPPGESDRDQAQITPGSAFDLQEGEGGSGDDSVFTGEVSRLVPFLMLVAVFIIAGCGIIYELLVGSISSYFLGNSVEQYSLTIGFFLFAMGVGSWFSRAIHQRLLKRFVELEIWLGLFGGLTVPALYIAYTYTDAYQYFMLLLILILGTLIGLEIPLLTRILRSYGSLRTILSNVLSMDYLGALVAAILFPFFCLPVLGPFHTSMFTGALNVVVGAALLAATWRQLKNRDQQSLVFQIGVVSTVLFVVGVRSEYLLEKWESAIYRGQIIFNEDTKYQKLVVTRWKDETRLFINEHLQFSSVDEYRYHEALVHPAMSLARNRQRVLIVGGGDGLAVREFLKYKDVEHIDLVDLDPVMTRLGKRNLYFTELNRNSLSYPRVHIHNEDAFIYLQREHEPYSVAVVDLPDPREEALSKLYTVEAYQLYRRHLSPGGILVTQSASPYYSRKAYWCIGKTMEDAGFKVVPYHAYVPSFGEWGFQMGAEKALDPEKIEFNVPLSFLSKELFADMLRFAPDMSKVEVESNALERPRLTRYYREGYEKW